MKKTLILTIVGTVLNLLPTTEAQAQTSGSGSSNSYYSSKFRIVVTGACRGCPNNRPLGNDITK